MKIKEMVVGKFYETKIGTGECLDLIQGSRPAAKMQITSPFPRGVIYVAPRDVIREVPRS